MMLARWEWVGFSHLSWGDKNFKSWEIPGQMISELLRIPTVWAPKMNTKTTGWGPSVGSVDSHGKEPLALHLTPPIQLQANRHEVESGWGEKLWGRWRMGQGGAVGLAQELWPYPQPPWWDIWLTQDIWVWTLWTEQFTKGMVMVGARPWFLFIGRKGFWRNGVVRWVFFISSIFF